MSCLCWNLTSSLTPIFVTLISSLLFLYICFFFFLPPTPELFPPILPFQIVYCCFSVVASPLLLPRRCFPAVASRRCVPAFASRRCFFVIPSFIFVAAAFFVAVLVVLVVVPPTHFFFFSLSSYKTHPKIPEKGKFLFIFYELEKNMLIIQLYKSIK